MTRGIVKRYNSKQGYGYLVNEAGTEVFFLKRSVCEGLVLEEGQIVEYDEIETEVGQHGTNIKLLAEANIS